MESSDTDVDIEENFDMTGFLFSLYKKEKSFPPRCDRKLIRRFEIFLSQFCRLNSQLSRPATWRIYLLSAQNIASEPNGSVFDWVKEHSGFESDFEIVRDIKETLEELDDINFQLERPFQLFLYK